MIIRSHGIRISILFNPSMMWNGIDIKFQLTPDCLESVDSLATALALRYSEGKGAIDDWKTAIRWASARCEGEFTSKSCITRSIKIFLRQRSGNDMTFMEGRELVELLRAAVPVRTKVGSLGVPFEELSYPVKKRYALEAIKVGAGRAEEIISGIVAEALERKDASFFADISQAMETAKQVDFGSLKLVLALFWRIPAIYASTIYPFCFWTDGAIAEYLETTGFDEVKPAAVRQHRVRLKLDRPTHLYVEGLRHLRDQVGIEGVRYFDRPRKVAARR